MRGRKQAPRRRQETHVAVIKPGSHPVRPVAEMSRLLGILRSHVEAYREVAGSRRAKGQALEGPH